jgi:transcriptional regulator GlxA family with amidase domain
MTARERFAQATDVAASEITETTLDEQMLQKAMDIVKAHLSDTSFTADDLARELGMARTNVYKKLQFITGKTPAAFIRTIRLKHGRQMLEHDPKLFVSQVAYECGFANPKLFSRYFKEEFGIYPKEIKG